MSRWIPRLIKQLVEPESNPAVFRRPESGERPRAFLSLRWKAVAPLLALVLIVSMVSAYLISDGIARSVQNSEIDRLLFSSRAVSERMGTWDAAHQREALRIAYTQGVASATASNDGIALQPVLEPLAAAADLDYVMITGSDGREVLGLQRVNSTGTAVYAVASGTELSDLVPVQAALAGQSASAVLRTGQGHALFTSAPVFLDEQIVGVVLVGTRLERVLDTLRGGDQTDLALYGVDGTFLRTTLPVTEATFEALRLPPGVFEQTLEPAGPVPVERLTLNDKPYRAAYIPLVIGGAPLGVVGTYQADNTLYATTLSREWFSVSAAGLAALVVVVTFAIIGHFTGRLERITQTAHSLASGHPHARTGMLPHDEIGELGAALDQLADHHQRKTDALQKALRRQREETSHLNTVLESIPDGLVVQDLDGRVLLINEAARKLLGGQRAFRSNRLHELTAVVTEKLGPALAPGIYALGDPTRIPLDDKMLQAQAAAILTKPDTRIGTVIVLRDITAEVEREQAREDLLGRLSQQATTPFIPQSYTSLSALAHEVVRHTRSLQRVITELRDLSTFEPRDLHAGQRALPLNDLLWNIAAEWQPLAKSAGIRLQVRFGPRGQHLLGDDRRLRWAIGNLIDNALKYSPPGSTIMLDGGIPDDAPGMAEILVEDQGYGISPEDLANAFTRFYRGSPMDRNNQPVRKPGTGQGLFITRRVIEAHGGQVSLASRVGIGTTVTVRLPLTAPVTLEMPADVAEPAEEDVKLPKGGPYDTVPLEPHQSLRRRRRK